MMETRSKEDLEWGKVLASLQGYCLSHEGSRALEKLPFTDDREELSRRQDAIDDFRLLMASGMIALPEGFPDVEEALSHLDDLRYTPDGPMLYAIATYIRSAEGLCRFTKSTLEDKRPLPHISSLFGEGVGPSLSSVKEEIFATLDPDGSVKKTHPAIAALIRRVESAKTGRVSFARQFIVAHRNQVQADQGALRDGRLVIPMRSDRTGKGDGFVSGESASGNTLFVEPFRLVELNNEVTLAQNQILIETARILRALAEKVRAVRHAFFDLAEQVGRADGWYALARAVHLGGMHRVEAGDRVRLWKARHPLLGTKAVPITVDLDAGCHAVVLSGPNAGGKTVTVKTVALLALMHQFLGYVPAEEGSMLPLFDEVFTEIGDEQSIENGLSTFSSHMRRIAQIMHGMTARSLVVLDELGSGTDPVEGSALARAILEACLAKGCLTLVTSHHGVLKEFAYARKDVMNASMAFDEASHEPTFRVIQGVPGDSHALDTATRQGVPQEIVARAREYLGSSAVQIGEIIKGLEAKRRDLDARDEALKESEAEVRVLRARLAEEELDLRKKRLEVVDREETDLGRFLRNKNKELEHLMGDLRGGGGLSKEQEERARAFIASVQAKKREAEHWIDKEERSLDRKLPVTAYQVGDHVLCGNAKRPGVVTEVLKGGQYRVAVGAIRMQMKGKDLQPDTSASEQDSVRVSYSGSTPAPKFELDLRGLTLAEALHQMDLEIESCLVHGVTRFGVIHGLGDGILSKGIGEYLDKHPAVKSHRFADANDGGWGKTYVQL